MEKCGIRGIFAARFNNLGKSPALLQGGWPGVLGIDRADAVFGAMTPVRRIQSYNLVTGQFAGNPWDGHEGQWKLWGEDEPQEYIVPGTWCG